MSTAWTRPRAGDTIRPSQRRQSRPGRKQIRVQLSDHSSLGMLPLTLIAMGFLVLAPVFWLVSELPPGQHIPRGYENAALYQYAYPALSHGFERIRNGGFPFWSSEQQCGYPFAADPRTGLFQPLNLVFLLGPTANAMALQAFLCLFLAGAGFAVYARSLNMRYVPAFLGALTFTFSGGAAALMSNPALAATFAWAPLLFWAVRDGIRNARPRAIVLGALATAGVLLGGAWGPAVVLLLHAMLYAAGLLLLARHQGKASTLQRARGIAALFATGILVAAVQILPTLRWALTLDDPLAFLFATDLTGQLPTSLWELAAQVFGARAPSSLRDALPGALTPAPAYAGMLPLLVAPAAWFHREARTERFYCTLFLLAVVVLHLVGALQPEAGNLLNLLYVPAAFCLATLAALGSDRLLETGRDPRSPLIWLPVLLLVLMACVGLYAAPTTSRGLILLNLAILFPFIVMRLRWLAAPTGLALAALAFVDLATANANYYQHPYEDAPDCYARNLDLLARAGEQALGDRIHMEVHPLNPHLTGNAGFLTGLRLADGALLPRSHRAARWWEAADDRPDLLRLAAVRARIEPPFNTQVDELPLVTPDTPREDAAGDLRMVYEDGRARILADDQALRRAVWLPRYEVVDNFDAALARLLEEDFDPTRTCIVEAGARGREALARRVPQDNETTARDANAACAITQDEPEHLRLRVSADVPGICLLNDTYFPGWTARVDGKGATILRANGLFRAIALDAGEHTIDFYYRPWTHWTGMALSAMSLLALFAYGLMRLFRPVSGR